VSNPDLSGSDFNAAMMAELSRYGRDCITTKLKILIVAVLYRKKIYHILNRKNKYRNLAFGRILT
jgi:hypothetical protein